MEVKRWKKIYHTTNKYKSYSDYVNIRQGILQEITSDRGISR